MKKFIAILLIVLVSVAVFPVSAQDDAAESCDMMEIAMGVENLFTGMEDAAGFMSGMGGETASDASAAVVAVDAFAQEYWTGYLESSAEGLCAELDWLGYNFGLLLDEAVILTQYTALATHAALAGDDDTASFYSDLATSRSANIENASTEFGETITEMMTGMGNVDTSLPACSEEEISATADGLDEIGTTFDELGVISEEAAGEELATLTAGYAGLSNGFWDEFQPTIPECQEAQDMVHTAGLIIDESLMAAASFHLAELETDAEIAAALVEGAAGHLETLMTALEGMGMMEEESE